MLKVPFRKELRKPTLQGVPSPDREVRELSPPLRSAPERVQEVRSLLMDDEDEARISPGTAIAVLYLVQFIVLGRPMPAFVERRWKEVGVLTRDGAPNAAMKKWGEALVTDEKTEGALRMVLMILSDLFQGSGLADSDVYKGEIAV